MRFPLRVAVLVALPLALRAQGAAAPLFRPAAGERLVQPVPAGWVVGHEQRSERGMITELVPAGQSVQRWTEMLTTQRYRGLDIAPEQFATVSRKAWAGACPGATGETLDAGTDRGRPWALWMQRCPRNSATGTPEVTWFKAIKGRDGLVVVHKAFRFDPSRAQVAQWTAYLRGVVLCDPRADGVACTPDVPAERATGGR